MVSLGLVSLLWCFISAAVSHVHNLHGLHQNGAVCCVCQIELVVTCLPVTVRTVLLLDHTFLLRLMHWYNSILLLYTFILLHVVTL